MTCHKIYYDINSNVGEEIIFPPNISHYINNVLRLKNGKILKIFNFQLNIEYQAVIIKIIKNKVFVKIINKVMIKKNIFKKKMYITLAQSIPKLNKMDLIIQKTTELGVNEILPFISKYTIPILTDNKKKQKKTRWEKIAIQTARQCQITNIPKINNIELYENIFEKYQNYDKKIILWEKEKIVDIKQIISTFKDNFYIIIIIGPEGGFSSVEIEIAKKFGFLSVSMGKDILKTETVGFVVLTIFQYINGKFTL